MANSEVLKLSLLLQLKDDASAGLAGFTRHLQKLDSQGKLTLKTLAKIRKELSRGGSSNFDKAAVASLKRIDAQSIKTVKGLDKVRAKLNQQAKMPFRGDGGQRDPEMVLTRGRRQRDPFADPRGRVERIGDFHDRYIEPTVQAGRVLRQGARETVDMFRPFVDSALNVSRAQSSFRLMNRSQEDTARGFKAVEDQIKSLGIITRTQGIETMQDLVNVFGTVDKAAGSLGMASKYQFGMESIFGMDPKEVKTQVQNAFKFLELSGKTSQAEMQSGFENITKIATSTGGRITGANFLAMGKTGAVASRDLDEAGLRTMAGLIEEMGASRAGTSLMSMQQALVGGRGSQFANERFRHYGLIDENKIEFGRAQKIKRLQPGANELGALMQINPMAAADRLRDAMQAKGVKIEYDLEGNMTDASARQVNQELSVLFPNRRANDLMSSLLTQRGSILKEAAASQRALGVEGMFGEAMGGPGQVVLWEKAMERLKEEVGGPLLMNLMTLLTTMRPLVDLMGQFPAVTAGGLGLLAVGKGVTTVTEAFSIFNSTNPRSLALLNQTRDGVVDVASAMTSNRAKVSGFAWELDGLGLKAGRTDRAIGGLRSSMRSLGSSPAVRMGVTLGTIAIAAGATEFLIGQIQQDLDRKAKNAELKVNLTGLVDEIFITGEAGKNTTRTAEAHQNFFTQLEDNGQLAKALHPDRNTWSDLVMGWLTLPTATGTAFQNPFAAIGNYANPTRHQYGTNYSGYGILSPRLTGQTSDTTAQAIAAIMATNKNLAQAVRDPKEAASILGKMPQWAEGAGLNRDLPMLNAAIKQLIVANAGGGKQGEEKWSLILDIMKDRGLATPILSMTPTPPSTEPPSLLGSFKPWQRPFSFMPPESKSFDLNRPGQLGAHQPFYSKPARPFDAITERRTERPSLVADAKPKRPFGDVQPFKVQPQSLTSLFDVGKSKDALNQFATPVQTNTAHLQNLSGPLGMNVTSFTDLQPHTGNTAQAFADLIDPANRVPPSFRTVGTSALALAIALDGVAAKIDGFQMPTIPGSFTGGGVGGGPKKAGVATGHAVPGRAIGGVVEHDGMAYLHAGNVVTPARVTRGLEGFDQLMSWARSSRAPHSPSGGSTNLITTLVQMTDQERVLEFFRSSINERQSSDRSSNSSEAVQRLIELVESSSLSIVNRDSLTREMVSTIMTQRDREPGYFTNGRQGTALPFFDRGQAGQPASPTSYFTDNRQSSVLPFIDRGRGRPDDLSSIPSRRQSPAFSPVPTIGNERAETGSQPVTINTNFNVHLPAGAEKADANKLEAMFRPLLNKHSKHIETLVTRSLNNGRIRS